MPISDPATITSTSDGWSYEPQQPHDDELEQQKAAAVTSQIRLKPGAQKIDKQVVLRRIRQRQRVNKVKGALNALFSASLFSSYSYTSSSVSTKKSGGSDCVLDDDDDGRKSGGRRSSGNKKMEADQTVQRWADDAFAAL